MPEAGTQLTRQSQELTIFHDVAKALTSSLDLDSILQTIMEKMGEYFRPDTWSLLMVDDVTEEHRLAHRPRAPVLVSRQEPRALPGPREQHELVSHHAILPGRTGL